MRQCSFQNCSSNAKTCKDEDKIRQYKKKKPNPVNIKGKCIYAFILSTGIIVTSKQFRL